jgi:hypothetical protein
MNRQQGEPHPAIPCNTNGLRRITGRLLLSPLQTFGIPRAFGQKGDTGETQDERPQWRWLPFVPDDSGRKRMFRPPMLNAVGKLNSASVSDSLKPPLQARDCDWTTPLMKTKHGESVAAVKMTRADSDLRAHPRIPISVPMRLEWETLGGDIRRMRGATSDLSLGGMHAFMRHPLAAGMRVDFDMTFPAQLTGGLSKRFLCQAKVVRCENVRGLFGLGIAISSRHLVGDLKLLRRSHARVSPAAPMVADVVGHMHMRKTVRDINREGAFIELLSPLPVGEEVQLVLRGRDLPSVIKVAGVVRRSEPGAGMGLEFTEVSRDADLLLRRCIGTGLLAS